MSQINKLTIPMAMLYPNARVLHPQHDLRTSGKPFPAKVVNYDVALNQLVIKTLSPSFQYTVDVSECKLELRSLNSITVTEELQLAEFLDISHRNVKKLLNGIYAGVMTLTEFRILADKLREWSVYINDLPEGVFDIYPLY